MISARVRNLVARVVRWAASTRPTRDTGVIPTQQVQFLGKVGDSVSWFPYGYHAAVPAGELALALTVLGVEEARVTLPGSPSRRPKPLATGEVAVYHPTTGSRLHFLEDGSVRLTAGGHAILVAAGGDITVTPAAGRKLLVAGDFEVTGAATFSSTVTSAGKDISDSHIHSGVTAGGSNTGPVV